MPASSASLIQEKQWVYASTPNKEDIDFLRKQLNLSEVTATLLLQRGISSYNDAFHFFRDTLDNIHDPFLMQDMDKAVVRLQSAIANQENILFYGDYDVDGTTSVSLCMAFFKEVFPHIPCDFYVPDRYTEGYGVSDRGIELAHKQGVTLMITLDCGIRATEKIAKANALGIDVIICDHHEPGEILPDAVAILDPKLPENPYPFKELSGCGVGFKLLQALCQAENIELTKLYAFLDFVAVSIACDIVPVVSENRILLREGLTLLNTKPRTGIKALLEVSGFKNELNVSSLVFGIGPRINAAGRIAHANASVELLLCKSEEAALEKAKSVDIKNELRKDYDTQITEEALEMIAAKTPPYCSNVLFKEDWHKGVIGIVASRCIEKDYKPTIILTESNGMATGSARSIQGFDVHEAIHACGHLLEKYGGHKYAAGLTLPLENVVLFQQAFEKIVASQLNQEQLIPTQRIDLNLHLSQINSKLYKLITQMAPFGPSNLQPILSAEDIVVVGEIRVLKEKHLKFSVCHSNDKTTLNVIGFQMIDLLPLVQSGEPMRICFQIQLNEFRGVKNLQLLLRDVQLMNENAY